MHVTTAEDKVRLDKAIKGLPLIVQGQIIEEIKANNGFKYYVLTLLAKADPYAEILISQRQAILNELNPANNPETMGLWKVLRGFVREQRAKLKQDGMLGQVEEHIVGKYGESVLRKKGIDDNGIKNCRIAQKQAELEAEGRVAEAKKPRVDILRLWSYLGIPMGLYSLIRGE